MNEATATQHSLRIEKSRLAAGAVRPLPVITFNGGALA
jgi:hypothetical protein